MVKKLLFVMNPYAGMRRANRFLADILSLFNAHGYEVTVHICLLYTSPSPRDTR